METKESRFYKVSELLPDALNRLYDRVKDRKVREMIEEYKNEYEKQRNKD
jgi:hypothetical protein